MTLSREIGSETPLSSRWRALARRKLHELDELAERIARMRGALELSLKCGCVRVEDCSLSPADVPERGKQRAAGSESGHLLILKTFALFVVTAVAEIVGCYLPFLWLRKHGSPWLLLPALVSLALFAWLLTLHPAASGRVYAAYGGVM